MVAHFTSSSPSASKPAKVVDGWLNDHLPIIILESGQINVADIKRVHCPEYVDKILTGVINNGFGNKLPEVAQSLLYTNGAMLWAGIAATVNHKVAVAPCSGFHHAGYASCFGYCTFNGLMITAMALKEMTFAKKVGILDFDMHDGDGTAELIAHHDASNWISHYSAGAEYHSAYQADGFLLRIPEIVAEMQDCDIILYQAGADPHINDPLGGFLTTDQLRMRDKLVFEYAKTFGVPVAWNLAGGYQVDADGGISEVINIHNNTMRECIATYTK
jgi:acetoin utilization deacetylase AcuC-like enzyme